MFRLRLSSCFQIAHRQTPTCPRVNDLRLRVTGVVFLHSSRELLEGQLHRQKLLTREIKITSSAGSALQALDAGLADGVPFDEIHASAALCHIAQNSSSFTRDVAESGEFTSLFKKTRAIITRGTREPRTLANILWAAASLHKSAPCLQELVPLALPSLSGSAKDLKAQEVANVTWALGMLSAEGDAAAKAYMALQARAAQVLTTFKGQELANLCWGLAVGNFRYDTFLNEVADLVMKRAPSMRPQGVDLDLPQIVCALARLGFRHEGMMGAVASRVSGTLHDMNDWGLCALLWSASELYPQAREGLSGAWQYDGNSRGVINGTALRWRKGRVTEITITSARSCTMDVQGTQYFAVLANEDQHLIWDDGETWTREDPKFVEFQIALKAAVSSRGLADRVESSQLGPERWKSQD